MHEKIHVKLKINEKGGYNGHTSLWREKPCKKLGGKRQKICYGALPTRRERGKVENFRKRWVK